MHFQAHCTVDTHLPVSLPSATAPPLTVRLRALGLLAARRLALPLLVVLAVRWLLGTAASEVKLDPFTSKVWIHWDGELYLAIAKTGYTLEHCKSVWAPHDWCGNAGWMPLYPFVVRWLGGASELGAVLVAFTASTTMLLLLWNLFLDARFTLENVLALLLAALFPGHIYQHAAFPTALTICLVLLSLWFAMRRPWAAALCGALATTAYPLGVLLAPVLGLGSLLGGTGSLRRRLLTGFLMGLGVLVGLAAAALVFHLAVGHADAYFLIHQKYGLERSNPLFMLLTKLHGMVDVGATRAPMWTGLQTLLVLVWVICLLPRRGAAPLLPLEKLILLYTLTVWLFPLTAGTRLDLYRSEALLVPSVVLARRLAPAHLCLFLAAFALLARPMALMYFTGLLE